MEMGDLLWVSTVNQGAAVGRYSVVLILKTYPMFL